jgi:hypothetical protein
LLQALSAQVTLQVVELRQSIGLSQPPAGQVILHAIPIGQVIGPVQGEQPEPQANVQTPSSHSPPAATQSAQATSASGGPQAVAVPASVPRAPTAPAAPVAPPAASPPNPEASPPAPMTSPPVPLAWTPPAPPSPGSVTPPPVDEKPPVPPSTGAPALPDVVAMAERPDRSNRHPTPRSGTKTATNSAGSRETAFNVFSVPLNGRRRAGGLD